MTDFLAGVTRLPGIDPAIETTPTSIVDLDRVVGGIELVRRAAPGAVVAYAAKASYLQPIFDVVRDAGARVSVFSELELYLARHAGFAAGDIIYNGVGRDGAALAAAVRDGVRVNVESLPELRSLLAAWEHGGGAPDGGIGLRVGAAGWSVADGGPEKYGFLGMPAEDLPVAADLLTGSGLRVTCLSFHRYANQLDAGSHLAFLDSLLPLAGKLATHPAVALAHLNVGGGFASRLEVGDERAEAAFRAIADRVAAELGVGTVFELGRFLVADAETLVSRVVDVRPRSGDGQVAILDATTNYLIPAPGHRFRVEPLPGPAPVDPGVEVLFVDRLGSEICRAVAAGLRPGTRVRVVNAGAYAGVMKERFVYPLPATRFVRHGRVIASAPGGDEDDVLAYHHWRRP